MTAIQLADGEQVECCEKQGEKTGKDIGIMYPLLGGRHVGVSGYHVVPKKVKKQIVPQGKVSPLFIHVQGVVHAIWQVLGVYFENILHRGQVGEAVI